MKLCPNPACPFRVRHGQPAEYLDRGEVCSDCTMPLVDERAFGSRETSEAVAAWHEERAAAAAQIHGSASPEDAARFDVRMGGGLIALGVVASIASALASSSVGGSTYFVCLGPLAYGVVRLQRGLAARRELASRAHAGTPYR